MGGRGTDRWSLRTVAPELAEHYRAEGWWTDETLGSMVEAGLASMADSPFRVRSQVRPWDGTCADVDRTARALAASLHARGVGPGDVVVFQLPNWMEAGATFWATAYLGATIVPIVHFYGPKEVGYILDTTQPSVVVTPDRFGLTEHLAMYDALLADRPDPLWLVVGDTPAADLPARATPFASMLDAEPLPHRLDVDPDAPAVIGFTSGTTSNPKGVIHSHRTIGFETRQLEEMFPRGGPDHITGAPVGHFIGMLNAFLIPLLRGSSVTLVDVWDPGAVLKLMKDEQLGVAGGATFFMASLLDHPDFSDEHLALIPFAGLGGSTVPLPFMERLAALGIDAYRSYGSTEHPSITGCDLSEPLEKRNATDGHVRTGCEIRLDDEGEISSRGPDLFMGYTDPELTASVFDEDGWYRTGDVGVLDGDGYLTITDRVSDIIIRGGENISAQEVEDLLLGLPAIAEVAVVAAPDARLGEKAAAIVRLHGEAEPPDLSTVREHLAAAGLAKQKWPEAIHVVVDFPRTASGKVQKFRLRQSLRDDSLETTFSQG